MRWDAHRFESAVSELQGSGNGPSVACEASASRVIRPPGTESDVQNVSDKASRTDRDWCAAAYNSERDSSWLHSSGSVPVRLWLSRSLRNITHAK
eukprot:scaffold290629_cov47-Prasinocladus_malaysianus.AAC.2